MNFCKGLSMIYLWLKLIHILSSTILFGTGIGTACVMLYGHRTRDTHVIAAISRYVVMADWIFTAPSAVVQPITGLAMVMVAGYKLTDLWLWGSMIGYIIAASCWFPVVCLQIQMRTMATIADQKQQPLPPRYYTYFNYWFWLGWPAFISLLVVFYLMTNKPM
jgi:uncharacterized membrane protein